MIDWNNFIKEKNLRKEVWRKKEAEKKRTKKGERQGRENFFIACASFD